MNRSVAALAQPLKTRNKTLQAKVHKKLFFISFPDTNNTKLHYFWHDSCHAINILKIRI